MCETKAAHEAPGTERRLGVEERAAEKEAGSKGCCEGWLSEERCWEMGSSVAARERARKARREVGVVQRVGVRAGCCGWEGGGMVCGVGDGRTGVGRWLEVAARGGGWPTGVRGGLVELRLGVEEMGNEIRTAREDENAATSLDGRKVLISS